MKKYTAIACGILLALGLQGCEKTIRISGEVARILVRPSDFVKKGQLLATLEPTDFKIEVDE